MSKKRHRRHFPNISLWWAAAFALLHPASCNIFFINNGYCEFELFEYAPIIMKNELHSQTPQRLGMLYPKATSRHVGHLGSLVQVTDPHIGGVVIQNITVPDTPPKAETHPLYKANHLDERPSLSPFHQFVIDVGKSSASGDCTRPKSLPTVTYAGKREVQMIKADGMTAVLVLVASAATILFSWIWSQADGSISRVEAITWAGIISVYYVKGFQQVSALSDQHSDYMLEVNLSNNTIFGDRGSGLFRNTPWVSSLFSSRRWDRKDLQTRGLVDSFPLIAAFVAVHIAINKLFERWNTDSNRTQRRVLVMFILGALMAGFLHETTLLIPLFIVTLNFVAVRLLAGSKHGRACIPVLTWCLGVTMLVASAFGALTLEWALKPLGTDIARMGRRLDQMKGELAWHSVFNLTMLRMISWSIDFCKSQVDASEKKGSPGGLHGPDTWDDERLRAETHRSLEEYRSFQLYFAYLFYPPLYITGPIVTFNAFVSYTVSPQRECVGSKLVTYWARWVADAFCFVLFGHYLYMSSINHNLALKVTREDTALIADYLFYFGQRGELLVWYSYWSLKWLWFKFLVVWRFARAWALSDGICPPENMNRCMSNNYTVRGFWRAWHRSFNRWLVRYVFVPIGGSRGVSMGRRFLTIGAVFTFVAIWHEPPPLLKYMRHPERCVPVELERYPFMVGKQYEAPDSKGVFWNVTLTKRNGDGTFGAQIDDKPHRNVTWKTLDPGKIRPKFGTDGKPLNMKAVEPYWIQCTVQIFKRSKTCQLLAWGWLFVIFMLPEVFMEQLVKKAKIQHFLVQRPLLTRHLTCLGGAVCIELLMLANLVGYSYGLDGGRFLLASCTHLDMILFMFAHVAWLFGNVQIMLIIRDREARSEAKLKGV